MRRIEFYLQIANDRDNKKRYNSWVQNSELDVEGEEEETAKAIIT